MVPKGHPVLFYDGNCGLCSRSVQFVIRHDKEGLFRFATLDSPIGRDTVKLVSEISGTNTDSVIVFAEGHYYLKADAALFILKKLRVMPLLRFLSFFVPGLLRNTIYDFIARNRYKWFGQSCMIIDEQLKAKLFL